MEQIAQLHDGTQDEIEGLAAIARPNDTYIVQLGPKRVAAMTPANRQVVTRWIREVRKPSPPPLSPYLQKAAVYSDKAGSEIIMALDLEGAMSFERVGKYLKVHEKSLQEWQANDRNDRLPMSAGRHGHVLSNVQGVRVGVRIGEQPSGMIVVDAARRCFLHLVLRQAFAAANTDRCGRTDQRLSSHGPFRPGEARFRWLASSPAAACGGF